MKERKQRTIQKIIIAFKPFLKKEWIAATDGCQQEEASPSTCKFFTAQYDDRKP